MKKNIRVIIKAGSFAAVFICAIYALSKFTTLPSIIDELIAYKNDHSDTSIWNPSISIFPIVAYRFCIYFSLPLLVSLFDFAKKDDRNYGMRLLENLEAEFFGYALLASVYYIFGLDIIFKSDIFSIQDSIIFVCSAVATLVLDKTLVMQIRSGSN